MMTVTEGTMGGMIDRCWLRRHCSLLTGQLQNYAAPFKLPMVHLSEDGEVLNGLVSSCTPYVLKYPSLSIISWLWLLPL